jgi:zinc D-Ala-D-Ala dipeptidase
MKHSIAQFLSMFMPCKSHRKGLPKGFAYLRDPRIILSMNYATDENFMGRKAIAYYAKTCILTKMALSALLAVQDELDTLNKKYRLRIFDSYRPTDAVADFEKWSQEPDTQTLKELYYPDFKKPDLFKNGYISLHSEHSRGSTVDLTISRIISEDPLHYEDLDMGTIIDFFGEKSHTDSKNISEIAQKNRQFLKGSMKKQGFINYEKEWWHYTLANEPFPETYFNFPVK